MAGNYHLSSTSHLQVGQGSDLCAVQVVCVTPDDLNVKLSTFVAVA